MSTTAPRPPRRWRRKESAFDAVLALELIEHVADRDLFFAAQAR